MKGKHDLPREDGYCGEKRRVCQKKGKWGKRFGA